MSALGFAMAADDAVLRAWVDLLAEEFEAAPAAWPQPPAARRRLPALPVALAAAAALLVGGLGSLAQATASLREGLLSQDPAVLRPLVDWARFRAEMAAMPVAPAPAGTDDVRLYLRQLADTVADGLATSSGTAAYLGRITAPDDRTPPLPRRTIHGWEVVLGRHAHQPAALVVADLPPLPQWLGGWRAVNLRVVHPRREP